MNYSLYFILRDVAVTGFQVWCVLLLLANEKEKSRLRTILWCVLYVTLIVVLSCYGTPIIIKFLVTVILISVGGLWIFETGFLNLLVYGVAYVLILYSCEMIVIQLWNKFNEPVYAMNIIYDDFQLAIIIVANTLLFITVFLVPKFFKKNTSKRRFKEILPNLLSGIPFLLVLFSIHISLPEIHKTNSSGWFLISSVGIFVAFIFNTMFTQHYIEVLEKKKKEERALYELQLKNDYYLKRLESEERVREVYHDLKNHFLVSDESVLEKGIREKLSTYEIFYETGNEFLNIVLADKIEKANKKGIKLECHVDFSKGGFIQPLDISTIFGNLLDNAMEASEQVVDEEKYIFLNVAMKRKLLIISVKNNMHILPGSKNSMITSKWNQSYHGYGLINIRKALKNYNGELQISTQGKEFMANIIIPMP